MKAIKRIEIILQKIENIEMIVNEFNGKVTLALNDELKAKPAILMHLINISEQITKLKDANEFEILKHFEKEDLKGLSDVRNFIAHDYEGLDMFIIETAIRDGLPRFKSSVKNILPK